MLFLQGGKMTAEKNKQFSISLCERKSSNWKDSPCPTNTSLEEPFDQYGLVWAKSNFILKLLSSGSSLPIPFLWRRKWQPTPVFLPRKSHGWRSLVGYSPWGHKELDTTERLHSLSLISSVIQLRSTVCNPMDCSTPGFPVLHYLPELAQIHVH